MNMNITADTLRGSALRIIDNVYNHEGALIIEETLLGLASDKETASLAPEAPAMAERLKAAADSGNLDEREIALSSLYRVLHAAGASYSPEEGKIMAKVHGIPKQPGGITPLLLSLPFISADSTVVDLGSGNGLQGLLLQRLAPHARTVMIELSGSMIEAGRVMERSMGLDDGRIVWAHADLMEADLEGLTGGAPDLLYIHRPVKPAGEGRRLYERIADWIDGWPSGSSIMSVADCMGPFLGPDVKSFYENEYLTVYRKA